MSEETETLLREFEATRSVVIQWTILGLAGFLVSLAIFGAVYAATTGATAEFSLRLDAGDGPNIAVSFLLFLVLSLSIIILHELIHGAVMSIYGATPEYGVGISHFILPYAYATSGEARFTRNQFIAIALAPLFVISTVGTVLMSASHSFWLVIPLATNASGAIGDLWMTVIVLRYPAHVRVVDRVTDMHIYGHSNDIPSESSLGSMIRHFLLGFVLCAGVVGISTVVLGPIILTELGANSLSVSIPGSSWMLFEYETAGSLGYSATVNPGGVFFISAAIGLLYAIWKQSTNTDVH